ncbi:MAG: hypothetical protein HKN47_01695 [Pirellulaceae bacterium]|nr:hypothetical protein [Pirellulaceae bacterium]
MGLLRSRRRETRRSGGYRSHSRRRRFVSCLEQLEARRLLAAEVEPNDDLATATAVAAGDTLEGTLSSASDVDYFVTTLASGERFIVDTFNVNAPLFSPTLPPAIEVFDGIGNLIDVTTDGRDIAFVAPSAGSYAIRIAGQNAFGLFAGEYAMATTQSAAPGDAESEPNNDNATANTAPLGRPFTGSILDNRDIDRFELTASRGDVVAVAFAGLPSSAPFVRLVSASGQVIATDTSGLGLVADVTSGETLYVEIASNGATDVLQYVAVINRFSDSTVVAESGSGFDGAAEFASVERNETLVGVLEDLNDVDLFRFEVDDIEFLNFDLQLAGGERIVDSGKELRLYNALGQLLERSSSGSLSTNRTDALTPGTHYIEVLATSPVGAGAYALSYSTRNDYSLQRDNALHYTDFDSTDPYLGFDRVAAYADAAGIPFFHAMLDAKYKPFEVELTRNKPVDGQERVASGIGDFGDIGAGGFGGGGRGIRSSQGNTVNNAREISVSNFQYYGTTLVSHEFGHATGLPHARDPQAFMSYVGTTELLPVGDAYAFVGTDSRRPQNSVYDVRNYLDWAMQPGAQVYAPPIDTATALAGVPIMDLMPYLQEMTVDHKPVESLATSARPFDSGTGDFNNDGRADVVVASEIDNRIEIYMAVAGGGFAAPVVINASGNLGWWTDAIEIGDLDNDGDDDLVVASYFASRMTVYRSNGDGTFAAGVDLALPRAPQTLESADIDADGDLDLIAAGVGSDAYLFTNAGDATFTSSGSFVSGPNTYSIASGDFNGDTFTDFAAANASSQGVSVVLGTAAGGFIAQSVNATSESRPESLVVADFDNDGVDDFAVANRDGQNVDLFLSVGNGTFTLAESFPLGIAPRKMEAADIDGDGNVDLMLSGRQFAAQVLLGQAGGSFSRPISLESGRNESSVSAGDFDNDGQLELAITSVFSDHVSILDQGSGDLRNDRVTVYGSIAGSVDLAGEVDRFSVDVQAGERYTFDIDAAEFQYPLDAILSVYDGAGSLIASNDDARDLNSGIRSVDPFLDLTFASAQTITIEVRGKLASSGDYRLKVTPERALETIAPRVIASVPANGAAINGTTQLVFYFDGLLDPDSLSGQSVIVTGATSGVVNGTATFNPFEASMVWTASNQLAPDDYTVEIIGDVGGVTDLLGNRLDGEIAAGHTFPDLSGDGVPGGNYMTSFTVTTADTSAAVVSSAVYRRDPYNRGQFLVRLNDTLSHVDVHATTFTLRGAGTDQVFGSADDTLQELDPVYDSVRNTGSSRLYLYSRGIPDSDAYRIDAQVIDGAGNLVTLSEEVAVGQVVPAGSLYVDQSLSTSGLTGSYVNQSLRGYAAQDDWRQSQTISGTRVDPLIHFRTGDFGIRSDVGVTGGVDDTNWDDFSVQWDGWIDVPVDGARLQTISDDGSRFWIDVNQDGTFDSGPGEFVNNGWGNGQGFEPSGLSASLPAGVYQIRVQFEEGTGGLGMDLQWVIPGQPLATDGFIHGPSVTDVSIRSGQQIDSNSPNFVSVTFSSSIDPATLTPDTISLRRSDTSTFFDGDDQIMMDTDGVIGWDASNQQATIAFNQPLKNGFYLLELDGDIGGIANRAGHLLDGEFLSSVVIGNDDPFIWENTPSGNGVQGGDYRTTFVVSQPQLSVKIADASISELDGRTNAVITRNFADLSNPLTVTIDISDLTELNAVRTVTIPAGQASVPIVLMAVDDSLLDGDQSVTVSATAAGITGGDASVIVTDYETLNIDVVLPEISEKGGVTELIISRLDTRGGLTVNILNDRTDKAAIVSEVFLANGQSSITVPITGVDNSLLDGTQTVTLTTVSVGMVDASTTFSVTDFEELVLEIVQDSISENGGVANATLTRTDPNGQAFASLSVDLPGQVSFPQNVQFQNGQLRSNPFQISALDNDLVDLTRSVTFTATAIGYQDATDTLEITDHEQLEIQINESTLSEFGGSTTARVIRTDASNDLTVQIVTDSSQLTMLDTLVIPAGSFLSDFFTVTTVDNDDLDGSRNVSVQASAVDHVSASETILITDHEELQLTVAGAPFQENGGTATFTLRRPTPGPAVDISLSGGNRRVIEIPDQVTIPFGLDSVTFTGTLVDDSVVNANDNVTIVAQSDVYQSASTSFVIEEDDRPALELTFVQNELSENGGSVTGRISRNTRSALTVQLVALELGRVELPAAVSFSAGTRFVDFQVTGLDNVKVDGDAVIPIQASAAGHPAVIADVKVWDNDLAGFSFVSDVGLTTVSESGGGANVGVVLNAAPLSNVDISLAPSHSQQIFVTPARLTFTPANWNQPQSVLVSAIDDLTVEPTETYQVNAAVVGTGSDAAFLQIGIQSLDVRVQDNDVAGIYMEQTNGSTIVSELGLKDEFFLRLESQPISPVTLLIDNTSLPQVDFTPQSVTFTPQNWDQVREIVVTTPLDFDQDRNSIGPVYVRVDDSTTAQGYANLRERTLVAVHVDSVLNDLRVRRIDDSLALVDEVSGQVLQSQPLDSGGVQITMGPRSERIHIEASADYDGLSLDTAGGNDRITLANYNLALVDGGVGVDTVVPISANVLFDLSSLSQVQLRNIERIDLSTIGAHRLNLSSDAVIASTDASQQLHVIATPEDVVSFQNDWQLDQPTMVNGVATHRLSRDGASVLFSNSRQWQNPLIPEDVNRDGGISPGDILALINRLSDQNSNQLPSNYDSDADVFYFDVNDDKQASPMDILLVINALDDLNQIGLQGEGIGGRIGVLDESDVGLTVKAGRGIATDVAVKNLRSTPPLQQADWMASDVDAALSSFLDTSEDDEDPADLLARIDGVTSLV